MKCIALVVLLASACTTTNSQDVTTHGIYAELGARADGDGLTNTYATLFFGNPLQLDFVRLTGNDQLMATNNGLDMVMTEAEILGVVSHSATFQGDAEGSVFEIALLRTVDHGAPSSTCTLPAKFTFGQTLSSASRMASLTVSWTPMSMDQMSWTAEGDCIETATGTLSDTGALTIPAATLKKRQGMNIADSCMVALSVSRTHLGQLDPGYGQGGTITGEQRRKMTFTSLP